MDNNAASYCHSTRGGVAKIFGTTLLTLFIRAIFSPCSVSLFTSPPQAQAKAQALSWHHLKLKLKRSLCITFSSSSSSSLFASAQTQALPSSPFQGQALSSSAFQAQAQALKLPLHHYLLHKQAFSIQLSITFFVDKHIVNFDILYFQLSSPAHGQLPGFSLINHPQKFQKFCFTHSLLQSEIMLLF